VYNVPGRTACDLLPETMARLCEVPLVVGIKEATGSAQRAAQIISRVGDRMVVLSGDDATAFPLYALGAHGCISVWSNVAPAEMAAMWDAAVAGNWNKARELHYRVFPLSEGLFIEANPIPVKAALAMMARSPTRSAHRSIHWLGPIARRCARFSLTSNLSDGNAMAEAVRIAVLGPRARWVAPSCARWSKIRPLLLWLQWSARIFPPWARRQPPGRIARKRSARASGPARPGSGDVWIDFFSAWRGRGQCPRRGPGGAAS